MGSVSPQKKRGVKYTVKCCVVEELSVVSRPLSCKYCNWGKRGVWRPVEKAQPDMEN